MSDPNHISDWPKQESDAPLRSAQQVKACWAREKWCLPNAEIGTPSPTGGGYSERIMAGANHRAVRNLGCSLEGEATCLRKLVGLVLLSLNTAS